MTPQQIDETLLGLTKRLANFAEAFELLQASVLRLTDATRNLQASVVKINEALTIQNERLAELEKRVDDLSGEEIHRI